MVFMVRKEVENSPCRHVRQKERSIETSSEM